MTTWTTAKADHENTGAAAPLRARPGPKWNGVTGNALRHSLNHPRPSGQLDRPVRRRRQTRLEAAPDRETHVITRYRTQSNPLEQRLGRLGAAQRGWVRRGRPGVR